MQLFNNRFNFFRTYSHRTRICRRRVEFIRKFRKKKNHGQINIPVSEQLFLFLSASFHFSFRHLKGKQLYFSPLQFSFTNLPGLFQISGFFFFELLQDYHRFHFPVSGTIEQFVDVPGCLYTVRRKMQLKVPVWLLCDQFYVLSNCSLTFMLFFFPG